VIAWEIQKAKYQTQVFPVTPFGRTYLRDGEVDLDWPPIPVSPLMRALAKRNEEHEQLCAETGEKGDGLPPQEWRGVTIESRYGNADELITLVALVERLPAECRDEIQKIFANSKCLWGLSVTTQPNDARTREHRMAIAKAIGAIMLDLRGAHMGIAVDDEYIEDPQTDPAFHEAMTGETVA
jgi:hypothetical protein